MATEPTDAMVEAAARVLYESGNERTGRSGDWDDQAAWAMEPWRQVYRDEARAALRAALSSREIGGVEHE